MMLVGGVEGTYRQAIFFSRGVLKLSILPISCLRVRRLEKPCVGRTMSWTAMVPIVICRVAGCRAEVEPCYS